MGIRSILIPKASTVTPIDSKTEVDKGLKVCTVPLVDPKTVANQRPQVNTTPSMDPETVANPGPQVNTAPSMEPETVANPGPQVNTAPSVDPKALANPQPQVYTVPSIDQKPQAKVREERQIDVGEPTSLREIKARNVESYELVETDIEKIWRCLDKEFPSRHQEKDMSYIMTAAISCGDARETVLAQCDNIPKKEDDSPSTSLKIAIPYQRPGHWNLVTIDVDEKKKKAVVRCFNTDGKAYPLEEKMLEFIKDLISIKRGMKTDDICTIEETEVHYEFEGQRGLNCGIVTACMMFDYLRASITTDSSKEIEKKSSYANIIHRGMFDQAIRDTISELINKHGEVYEKKYFCSDKPMAFHGGFGGTEYVYNSNNADERELYESLIGLNESSFSKVHDAINKGEIKDQIAKLRDLYTKEGINIRVLFKNEELEVHGHWRELILHTAAERQTNTRMTVKKSGIIGKITSIRENIGELLKNSTFQYLVCLIGSYYFFGITGCMCATMTLFTIKMYIQDRQVEATKMASTECCNSVKSRDLSSSAEPVQTWKECACLKPNDQSLDTFENTTEFKQTENQATQDQIGSGIEKVCTA